MQDSLAVVLDQPERLALRPLPLDAPGPADVVVETEFSGVSAGTERLLFYGRMPAFPGMGYPLVPGYETVGRVLKAGPQSGLAEGERVFAPGAHCFGPVRGLHGAAASHLVVPAARVTRVSEALGDRAVLLALAATAQHAWTQGRGDDAVLIVGHGVLGRLLARLALRDGAAPTVWETAPIRCDGGDGYPVIAPEADPRRDYRTVFDVSGDPRILDTLIPRLARGGLIVLAGFYDTLSFAFPPAFMREIHIRVAAQWAPDDLQDVVRRVESGELSLDGLITHRRPAREAERAYPEAFGDPACLKMVLDWRTRA